CLPDHVAGIPTYGIHTDRILCYHVQGNAPSNFINDTASTRGDRTPLKLHTWPELLLSCTVNLYVTVERGVTVSIWHGLLDNGGEKSREGPQRWCWLPYTARSGNSTVLFWGHSLGSGGATNVARKQLEEKGIQVESIVLESPYTNIRETAAHSPVTRIYCQFPGFEDLILDSMALDGSSVKMKTSKCCQVPS
uniref:Uncharacterized protein n=1 Tax=Pelusios castaneus TaxID=367368 RepID=A0A8C8VP55_9SAUR